MTTASILLAGLAGFGGACGADADRGRSSTASASSPSAPAAAGETAVSAQAGGGAASSIKLTTRTRQRIEGWGTAVTADTFLDPWGNVALGDPGQARRLDRLTLRAGINLVRIFAPGPDPGRGDVAPWSGSDGRLALVRRLAGKGVRFLFTGNGAPSAMLENGGPFGKLKPGSERAYAMFLADCLDVAKRAGVDFPYAAIGNEVDNPGSDGRLLSPEQAATVIAALADEIRRRGLRTRVVLGDTTTWPGTLEYAAAQYAVLRRDQVAFVATHSYGGEDSRPALARFARERALPLWMTEWVSACPKGDCPDDPSIGFALRWAGQITADLTVAHASAWFMFRGIADSTHGADGAIVIRTRGASSQFTTTKRYPVLRQFTIAAPRGVRRADTTGTANADVLRVGFTSRRRRALVLTNMGSAARTVRAVLSSRPGRLQAWRTSASESFAALRTRRLGRGAVAIELPAQSITTLVYQERP